MAIFDLYSKRQRRLRGEDPDVYQYEEVPEGLRVQVIHIWGDAIGKAEDYERYENVQHVYKFVADALCREYGIFRLADLNRSRRHHLDELVHFLLNEGSTERVLDAIELSFKLINTFVRQFDYLHRMNHDEVADDALAELNDRFKEHGVGYQFVGNDLIRVDSELIHQEAVKPALRVLHQEGFEGAEQEFLKAYEHYRKGEAKEALNNALKAFESTMKTICDKNEWSYDPNATSKTLIDVCFNNGLVPPFWQSEIGALRTLLESSVPTGRNKLSGHGQGTKRTSVPDHVVAYVLHMTASVVLFLTEADKAQE